MMNRYFALANWRYYRQKPLQPLLALLGIALGIAVILGVDIINYSARHSLARSVAVLSGEATHHLKGATATIPESLYRDWRLAWPELIMSPLLVGEVDLLLPEGETLSVRLLGIDLIDAHRFRQYTREDAATTLEGQDFWRLLAVANTVLLPQQLAGRWPLQPEEHLTAHTPSGVQRAQVIGFTRSDANTSLGEHVLLTDIATAQEWLAKPGQLSQIELQIHAEDEASLSALQKALPNNVMVVPAQQSKAHTMNLTVAFHNNLTALSLLALFVGIFLVYNAVNFMIVQRTQLYGVARVLGLAPQQLQRQLMQEILLLGLVGFLLGGVLGILLAQGLLAFVLQTIDTLYYHLLEQDFVLTGWAVAKAALALLLALAIALRRPWVEMQQYPAITLLRAERVLLTPTGRLLGAASMGLLLFSLAFVVAYSDWLGQLGLFLAQFLLLVGSALCLAPLLHTLYRFIKPACQRFLGVQGVLLAVHTWGEPRRLASAAVALTIALATTVTIALNVDAFRQTVSQWLSDFLQADVYISAATRTQLDNHEVLPADVIERLQADARVVELNRYRHVTVLYRGQPQPLVAMQAGPRLQKSYRFTSGDAGSIWQAFQHEQAVLVSEAMAHRFDLQPGDSLPLLTEFGSQSFTIAGIYIDYASEYGTVRMRQSLYQQWWADNASNALALSLAQPQDSEQFRQDWQSDPDLQAMALRTPADIQRWSLVLFDETFLITQVLTALVMAVAWIALLSALLARQMENSQEQALLRVLGLSPRQLLWLQTGQVLGLAVTAALLALPLGVAMTSLLLDVLYPRWLGWEIDWHLSASVVQQTVLLAVSSALTAVFYPAYRAWQLPTAQVLKND